MFKMLFAGYFLDYIMSELKAKLQNSILDSDFSAERVPAIKEAIQKLRADYEKKKRLLNSFPGILLLGDWHGEKVNLAFFEEVKKELVSLHCNVFTLQDIALELSNRGIEAGDLQIRVRGIDAAEVVLMVDGCGPGTVGETTNICEKKQWNEKCIFFVEGSESNALEILKGKDYLRKLHNPVFYYSGLPED